MKTLKNQRFLVPRKVKLFSDLKIIIVIFALAMLIPFASAYDVTNVKSAYLPKETFQAELSGDFAKSLVQENFELYKNNIKEVMTFNIEQLANNKFFIYFNLPDKTGSYSFIARDIMYVENGSLRKETINKNFTIKKPIYWAYNYLSSSLNQLQQWQNLNAEENALALSALVYNDTNKNDGKTALLEKRNLTCYPFTKGELCDVKSTALALIALNQLDVSEKIEAKDWLLTAQNTVDKGIWNLVTETNVSAVCTLKVNQNEQQLSVAPGIISHSFNIQDEKTIKIRLSCGNLVTIVSKIVNTYQGATYTFPMTLQNNSLEVTINNEKCWGTKERTDCSVEATAYALWALYEIKETNLDTEWLLKNVQTTIQKSFLYLANEDSEIENWLIQNQAIAGYFSEKGLAISTNPDMSSTIIATYTLSKSSSDNAKSAVQKAKIWLLEQYDKNTNNNFGTLSQTSFALYKIFPYSEIEPSLAIKPAVVKVKSGDKFTITMKNSGISKINLISKLKGEQNTISVLKDEELVFPFTVTLSSSDVEFENLELTYSVESSSASRTYNIPIMIFPKESVIEKEVNETNIKINLVQPNIEFIDETFEKTFGKDSQEVIEIKIKNPSLEIVQNIDIAYSNNLRSIISVKPTVISDLNPGEEATIFIVVNTKDAEQITYSGFIEIQSSSFSTQLPVTINIGEKTEVETNINTSQTGTEDNTSQTQTEKQKPKTGLIIGIILIVIAVLAVIAFVLIKTKKRKSNTVNDALSKIEEKYKPHSGGLIR